MGKILKFKSCAKGGEYTGLGAITPTSYYYVGVDTPANIVNTINNAYKDDPDLSGKVKGIGYGWQQYTIPSSGNVTFTVRGAAGGCCTNPGFTIDPITGAVSGTGNRPGRGAKIVGKSKLKKGDILYMLVGIRGWCNKFVDYGGGGGGASVVLKDNPAGSYTFAPLNRKVDVLVVAGGGGGTYDQISGLTYYGADAVLTNGVNTNGGSSRHARGGSGLTGNGSSGSGGNPSYSILSGTPSHTTLNATHYGGWGGGGGSYNGGGGGGGYSGGVAEDSRGGSGGTSYINPTLCTEISRGYATVEADSERNLTNPWTAYGFIELELGRDENKYILAEDDEGLKYFDGAELINGDINSSATNEWKLVPDPVVIPPDENLLGDYGNAFITNRTGLNDQVRFYVMSKEAKEYIEISGNVDGALLEQNFDSSISDISLIKKIDSVDNLENLDVRFAMSKDSGKTWQTYNYGSWDDIDIYNKAEFKANGWNLAQFDTIPLEDWNAYKAKTIRFAAIITQNGPNGKSILEKIEEIADLVGSWRHFKEDEATYEYTSDTDLKITFHQGGNYKVNYLDSINN